VRSLLVCVAVAGLLAGCGAPDGGSDNPAAGIPATDPNTFRADIDASRPYAGEWAAATHQCADEDKIWTIEPRRMAIVPAMRFCAFDDVYVSDGPGDAPSTWSASAKCLAEGRESHDFLFFRVKDNLREMRVTFNDTSSVELVRCPMKS
jgi:hypothetical protein